MLRKPHRFALLLVLFCFPYPALFAEEPASRKPEAASPAPKPLSKEQQRRSPILLRADRVEGHTGQEADAKGSVELRQGNLLLNTDQLHYSEPDNEVSCDGNVRFEKEGDVVEGTEFKYDLDNDQGYMEKPNYRLVKRMDRKRPARGDARRIEFLGENQERLTEARYTTCAPGQDDWFLRVKRLDLDRAAEVGEARNATVVFKGVPMFYMPWVSFPLSDKRKSGFLTPVFGSTGRSGIEASVPYYWNIAPNMDATLTPRVLSKRGLQAQNEFRYLWPLFHGEAHADLLPNDRQTDLNRYFLTWAHAQNLTHGWSSNLNLQKASDDNYFRDLSTRLADTSTTNLPRDGLLTYSARYWNFSTRLLSYQHLLDPARPATPDEIPYRMRPQFLFNAERQNVYRADWTLAADWTDFSHPSKANGKRFLLYPSVSYPITRSYAFLTPRLGYHHTEYTLSENFTGDANFTRNLPIYSVDSGVIFERDLRYKDEPLLQTLEPRLFYVRIPFREQSQIPNFSTTQADFNFAQIYTENQFIGGDRVNDANQLTAGVSTRFIEQKTGIERLRAGIAQRLYFNEPRVTLSGPNVALGRRTSDLLIGFDGQISKKWAVDGLWQYNPDSRRSEKLSIGGRYNPEPGKVANLAYRTARATLTQPTEVPDQVDFSVQWPLWKHWYGLGRVNYAIGESKLLEGLAGLEYNRGCWELRLVAHRFITAEQQVSTSFFVQLELNGLSRFGTNPLEALRQNIPGYVKSQETNP